MSTISASTTSTTAFKITTDTTGTLVFQTGASPTTAVTMDASQNVGLGVTPTNNTLGKTLQVGQSTALTSDTAANRFWLGSNWYYNAGDKYITTGNATLYSQQSGTHQWFTAGSGTAGNAITFTQAMTLDASGNLGIGTTSPSSFLSTQRTLVLGAGSGNVGQTIYTGSSSQGTIAFADGLTGDQQYRGYIAYIHSSDALTFGSAGAERARIDTSGNLLVGVTTATSGGGVLQLSSGITFPATQVASSNVNTLDDYEEGTFTPVFLNTTATYSTPVTGGTYIKIGRMVFVSLVITSTSLTRNASAFEIGGLPFSVENSQPNFAPPSLFPETGMNPAGGAGNIYGLFIIGSTYARMYTIANSTGDNYTTMTYNDLQTGANRIRIAGCYRTDA